MKIVETYRWRTLWAGKMSPTRYHCTEEQIRARHPEAERIDNTLMLREVYEDGEAPHGKSSSPMPGSPDYKDHR